MSFSFCLLINNIAYTHSQLARAPCQYRITLQHKAHKFSKSTPNATSDAESVFITVTDNGRRAMGYGLLSAHIFMGVFRYPIDTMEVSDVAQYYLTDDRYAHSGEVDISFFHFYYHIAKLLFCRPMEG